MANKKKAKKPAGPPADRLTIEGVWQDATRRALDKKRPAEGWPNRPVKTRSKRTKGPRP